MARLLMANGEKCQSNKRLLRKNILQECMQNAYELKVPLVVQAKTGKNWYMAK